MAQQGSPPGRLSRQPGDDQRGSVGRAAGARRALRPPRPGRPGWQRDAFAPEDTDADLPAWAEPGAYRARSAGPRRLPASDPFAGGYAGEDGSEPAEALLERPDGAPAPAQDGRPGGRRSGRAAAARLRKSRRRVYRWSAITIVACVLAAVIVALVTSHGPKPSLYVTSLQAGEFTSVPNACTSVSSAVLVQYLPGTRTTTSQVSEPTQSQCSFTIDAKPVFRLLQVSAQAYQPFAAATGNGSASANAKDSLVVDRAALASPPKKSLLSPADIVAVPKLGQQAFAAAQRETAGGIVSDVVTVVVLERNVLISVALSAQESGGFTETAAGTLEAGATAAARDVLAKVLTRPTA